MSMNLGESMDLHRIKTYTEETYKELEDMNAKMDKQIALLERIVRILESRADDGR